MPLYYTQDHEWIDSDGTTGTIGITDYAQGQLGDITFVELPEAGSSVIRAMRPAWSTASRPPPTFTRRSAAR